MRSRQMLKHK